MKENNKPFEISIESVAVYVIGSITRTKLILAMGKKNENIDGILFKHSSRRQIFHEICRTLVLN